MFFKIAKPYIGILVHKENYWVKKNLTTNEKQLKIQIRTKNNSETAELGIRISDIFRFYNIFQIFSGFIILKFCYHWVCQMNFC